MMTVDRDNWRRFVASRGTVLDDHGNGGGGGASTTTGMEEEEEHLLCASRIDPTPRLSLRDMYYPNHSLGCVESPSPT